MLQNQPTTRKKEKESHTIHQHLWRHDVKAIVVMSGFIVVQFFLMTYVVDASELTIKALLDCTNQIRLSYHQPNALVLNKQLTEAADAKLQDMAQYKYWAHQNPVTGKQPWDFIDAVGYDYETAGENLAYGFTDSQKICDAWEKSPKHLANIIDPTFQEIGFAVDKANLHQNEKGILVVQLFGSRDDFSPPSSGQTQQQLQTQQLAQTQNCQTQNCLNNETSQVVPQVEGTSTSKTSAADSVYPQPSLFRILLPYMVGILTFGTLLATIGALKFKKSKKKSRILQKIAIVLFISTALLLFFSFSPVL